MSSSRSTIDTLCDTIPCMHLRQFLVALGDRFYYERLKKELSGMKTVLDVGCGSNSPLAKVKKTFYSVGVDVYKPNITASKKARIHDKYKLGNVLQLGYLFRPKSFDAVVALDIIEHLAKKDGIVLMEQMEKVAKKKVIILTPYGFTEQHPYDGNPFQMHKSGWYVKDFLNRGYKIYGMRGFRFIRGEYATIKYNPWVFWGALATLSQLVVYYFPRAAYQLLAVKKL